MGADVIVRPDENPIHTDPTAVRARIKSIKLRDVDGNIRVADVECITSNNDTLYIGTCVGKGDHYFIKQMNDITLTKPFPCTASGKPILKFN